jgi:hypothetical protein
LKYFCQFETLDDPNENGHSNDDGERFEFESNDMNGEASLSIKPDPVDSMRPDLDGSELMKTDAEPIDSDKYKSNLNKQYLSAIPLNDIAGHTGFLTFATKL